MDKTSAEASREQARRQAGALASDSASVASAGAHWDIPSLPLDPVVRQRQFEKAVAKARHSGIAEPLGEGWLLAWRDHETSDRLMNRAFRAWWCAAQPADADLLASAARYFTRLDADFVALSAWHPFAPGDRFVDVGASTHAWLRGERRWSGETIDAIEVQPFGRTPAAWSRRIAQHLTTAGWQDRQACDPRFDHEGTCARRLADFEEKMRGGQGFVVARRIAGAAARDVATAGESGVEPAAGQSEQTPNTGSAAHAAAADEEDIAAYILVPIDVSRQAFGGPAVAGISGVGGSLREGQWHYSAVLRAAYRHATTLGCLSVLQFQTTNRAMALLVPRIFDTEIATRYDRHWWAVTDR